MVRTRHYLKRWPGTTVAIFLLSSHGAPVGVCVYSLPPAETFKRYGVALAWELSRLWISDDMPHNTESWFIARTVDWVKRHRPEVECLVSYADPSQGHSGTIYKASNWTSDGMTDDERVSPRKDYYVGAKKYSRKGHLPAGVAFERVARISKFRYIYRLNQRKPRISQARQLQLLEHQR